MGVRSCELTALPDPAQRARLYSRRVATCQPPTDAPRPSASGGEHERAAGDAPSGLACTYDNQHTSSNGPPSCAVVPVTR